MLISFILLALASFGAGYAFHRDLNLKKSNPEPPLLDTPENVINYLEACSLHQDNPDMNELFSEFRLFVNQKPLPALEGKVEEKPAWYHDPSAKIPQDKHWDLFLTDLKRETDTSAKLGVVKHWIRDLKNNFSFKEMEMMLDEFEDSKDRAAVRKIFANKRTGKKTK